MSKSNKKFNNLAVTILMCLIIVVFVFTGVTGFTNSGNKVATIDDKVVTPTEFNRALQANLEEISKRNGGKFPSQKQIRDLGIQDNVIDQLVSQKILLRFAENLGFGAGKEAIKETIVTQYSAFKTNDQFDISKYKNILKLNGIQVKDFELDVIDQVKINKLNELFAAIQPSEKYLADQAKIRSSEAVVNAISFDKEKMTANLSVSDSEIETFFRDEAKSKAVVNSLYETYKATATKDKVKTIDSMKNQLAKEHIQKTKREELKKFNTNLIKDLRMAFKQNSWSKVDSIAKKNGLEFKKATNVNLLSPRIAGVAVDEEKFTKSFVQKDKTGVIVNETPLAVSILKITDFTQKKTDENDPFAQYAKFSQARTLNFKAIDYQREKSEITKYNITLQ